jgi:plasmid stabilization system protein ParE
MRPYILSAAARLDLLRIHNYLAEQASPSTARKVLSELRDGMRKVAQMPGLGHFRADLSAEPLRFWRVRSYLIVYRPDSSPLAVVRIFHAAQDVRAILAGG